jgi:hypothetical protein
VSRSVITRSSYPYSSECVEEKFSEVRGSKVDFEVGLRGIGVGLRRIPAFMFGVRVLGPHIATNEQARVRRHRYV